MVRRSTRLIAACVLFVPLVACSRSAESPTLPTEPNPPFNGGASIALAIQGSTEPLRIGGTRQLTWSADLSRVLLVAGSKPSWGSSDASVLTVDGDGLVTGVAAGEATVTISFVGETDRVVLRVVPR